MKQVPGWSIILVLVAVFSAGEGYAQFSKVATITHGEPVLAALDRPGELYLIFGDSTIIRYDVNGKIQQQGIMPLMPDVFDPHDGSRLFAFNRKSRRYIYFSPSFSFAIPPARPDSAFAIDPVFACASGDRDLILLDSADHSIKKVNLKTQRLLFESILSDTVVDFSTLVTLREYQNFVFMLDRNKGILIFNMLGRLLKTIPGQDIAYFGFLGEELYYPDGKSLRFFNLFTTETRILELPHEAWFALLTDERLYLVNRSGTDVFSLKP